MTETSEQPAGGGIDIDGENAGIDVFGYHQRSKHHFSGYAKGPDTIDWDRQPDPFRRFEGTPVIELPLQSFFSNEDRTQWFRDVDLNSLLRPESLPAVGISLNSIAAWLQHSLALSAWKQHAGSRWSLHCNPSSGNLHPTEAYLIVAGIDALQDGVYHYRADLHALEQRCVFADPLNVSAPQLFIGLSSVHWREAWKYGERAYRYCQLDIGHAVAALSYAGALNGWHLVMEPCADSTLEQLLGLDRQQDFVEGEEEWADCLLRVDIAGSAAKGTAANVASLQAAAVGGRWAGRAAVLDRRHFYQWPVIAEIADCVRRPLEDKTDDFEDKAETLDPWPTALSGKYRDNLSCLIRQRRSAQAFDAYTSIGRDAFFVLLDHLLPRADLVPWSALPAGPALHCVLFVHRVEGLEQGLYALPRSRSGEALMRRNMRQQFAWQPVAGAPAHLPFYQLIQARAERTAAKLSCQQAIAGDSAFSLAMLAEFSSSVNDTPWRYPELYWEAGAIGQVLYLEAEGIGLRGTGIGCFFDDAVHELLGIEGQAGIERQPLQSLYHFTVGGPLQDKRIVSLPPYGDRRGSG